MFLIWIIYRKLRIYINYFKEKNYLYIFSINMVEKNKKNYVFYKRDNWK